MKESLHKNGILSKSTIREKKGKTKSLQELYETTTTIDGYFVFVINFDISAFATYVEDARIDFVPIRTLKQFLRSNEMDRSIKEEQFKAHALYENKTWILLPKPSKSNIISSCKWLFTKKNMMLKAILFSSKLKW